MDELYRKFEPALTTVPLKTGEDDDEKPVVTFHIGDELFVCIPNDQIPAGALRRLSQSRWTVENTAAFIEGVLEDKDNPADETATQIERFRRTLERKDLVVGPELLGDIAMWLMGAITNFPTNSPSGSTDGSKATGNGSKAKRGGKAAKLAGSGRSKTV
jgi:hypothetical protein